MDEPSRFSAETVAVVEQQYQRHDEPDGRHRADGVAYGLFEPVPAPQQIDAQRREQEQQQEGDPVVLVHIPHQRALIGVVALLAVAVAGVLVGVAVVVLAGIVVALAVLVVALAVLVVGLVVVAVVIAVAGVRVVIAVVVAGIVVVAVPVVVVAVPVVVVAVVVAVVKAGVVGVVLAVGVVVVVVAGVRVVVVGVVGVVVLALVAGVVLLIIRIARLGLSGKQPMDLALAPAVGQTLLRQIEFQFSNRVCCHIFTTLYFPVRALAPNGFRAAVAAITNL